MRKERRRAREALFALLLATAIGKESAEGGVGAIPSPMKSALPQEAPASVFSAKLGKGPDDDAQLFISGSWSATVLASLDLQAQSGGTLVLSSAQPLLFTQAPDLSLSFLLLKKIFVEARIADDISQAKYSMGYRGGKGELLREARLGNDGISFPSLPFLAFGDVSYRSFGAAAWIGTESFTGRAMVRYDQADRVVKRFVGRTEVVDTELSPNAFVQGKFFLTRAAPATNLAIYVKSVSGTIAGGSDYYRKLDPGEYSYSAITGLAVLATAATTRVLAYYPLSGSDADAVALDGIGACDLLYDPPADPTTAVSLDPKLQVLSRYATTAGASSAEAFVRNPSSGLRDPSFAATIDSEGYVEVTRADAGSPSATDAAQRNAYRRPFESPAYAGMDWLYTTDFSSDAKSGNAPVYTRSVVVRSFSASETIAIDKDLVAGSIEVTRDGIPAYSFSVDADKGTLTLVPPPSATEEIVVSYMKQSTERRSGILEGALGGFWDFGEGLSAWAALGASWSLPGSSFASDSRTAPGSIDLTAGEKDADGAFTHNAAIAARYSRDDATGVYRIEGMESASAYSSTFRLDTAPPSTGYSVAEKAETELAVAFPKTIASLHSDGSTQRAVQIAAGLSPSGSAAIYKVEAAPPYASFKTISFFAKFPVTTALSLALDDGAASPASSIAISLRAGSGTGAWRRFYLHYGSSAASLTYQDAEGDAETALALASIDATPALSSTGSRLFIAVTGLLASESAWVDEVLLEDSIGRAALLFQGRAAYANPGLSASADVQAALDAAPYASGDASLEATVPFARIGVRARAVVAADSAASLSGGHTIAIPAADFPAEAKDSFEFDPGTGAFGRSDSAALRAGKVGAISAEQSTEWVPAQAILDRGMLTQSWNGSIILGPSIATIGISAANRSRPQSAAAPGGPGAGYGAAWIGAFDYALPAFEAESEAREAKARLSIKGTDAKEYLSASLGESAEPAAAGGALRRDSAAIRLALPLETAYAKIEPYYSRSWTDKRSVLSSGILGDAAAALGDISSLPLLYQGLPFAELASAKAAEDFSSQSASAGTALLEASLEPEAGLTLSREYGSMWYDFVAPSALSFSFRRVLSLSADQQTDSGLWSVIAKFAAVNLFGSMGAYPLGLPFDSDEYLSTLQASLNEPRDGSASSLDLQYHGLSTLYAGESDKLDAEGKLSLVDGPGKLDWSGSISLSLSRREARHPLLDLYALAAKSAEPTPKPVGEGEGKPASIASLYLRDLATRTPIARTTITARAGLSGLAGDAASYSPGWNFSESYEAKLTVPERLTFKVDVASGQSLDASTKALSLSLELGLNAVISF